MGFSEVKGWGLLSDPGSPEPPSHLCPGWQTATAMIGWFLSSLLSLPLVPALFQR